MALEQVDRLMVHVFHFYPLDAQRASKGIESMDACSVHSLLRGIVSVGMRETSYKSLSFTFISY